MTTHSSQPGQRNDSLDIIKGISCVTMVIAHQPYFLQDPKISLGLINHLAGAIPPTLFFATAGITASLQSTKYSLRSLMLYFGALFVIGLTWNIALHGDLGTFYWPEIFQTIAIGSFLICVFGRNGPAPQTLLLSIGMALALIKPLAKTIWPDLDGWHYLFCDHTYTPDNGPNSPHPQILPGFPLLPWTGYFFLGAWSYRAGKPVKLAMTFLALGLAALSTALGSDAGEKWDTSIAFSFTSCTIIFATFWLFHRPVESKSWLPEQLRKIGGNALLFFFVHPLGLLAGGILYAIVHNAYLGWATAITVAILIYNFFNLRKPWKLFERETAWLVMMAIILLLPFVSMLIKNQILLLIPRLLALIIGTIAAINFPLLSNIVKRRKNSPRTSVEIKSAEYSLNAVMPFSTAQTHQNISRASD